MSKPDPKDIPRYDVTVTFYKVLPQVWHADDIEELNADPRAYFNMDCDVHSYMATASNFEVTEVEGW